MGTKIIQGDCIEQMKLLEENSVDAIITDPPYNLSSIVKRFGKEGSAPAQFGKDGSFSRLPKGFMGKEWDNEIAFGTEIWIEALRVLKPGGFLLSFGGTRTYHRLTCGIEDAGFEIRDTIMWLYGSGFPKSLNIGKQIDKFQGNERKIVGRKVKRVDGTLRNTEPNGGYMKENIKTKQTDGYVDIEKPGSIDSEKWEGWGTALKPACEPIVVARKPLSEKNVVLNVLKWGTGGINIDACRIGSDMIPCSNDIRSLQKWKEQDGRKHKELINPEPTYNQGRFPANIIFDEEAGKMLDEQSGISISKARTKSSDTISQPTIDFGGGFKSNSNEHSDKGGASRFFYCAKASKSERNKGTDSFINIEVFNMKCEDKQNEKSLTQEERLAKLSVDMETLQGKDIEEFGTQEKEGSRWNTLLFGKNIMEKYQKDIQSITKMETNLITTSQILNWLKHLLIKEYTLDANSLMESGGNRVENVGKSKELIITTNEKLASALGVKYVVSGTQLKIKLSEGKCDHPTVKPIALMEYLIKLVSKEGAVVLDPFLGSGTTLLACYKLNRNGIGIEKEEEYIKIAQARLNKLQEQTKLSA